MSPYRLHGCTRSSPRRVDLIISSTDMLVSSITRLVLIEAGDRSFLAARIGGVGRKTLQDALFHPYGLWNLGSLGTLVTSAAAALGAAHGGWSRAGSDVRRADAGSHHPQPRKQFRQFLASARGTYRLPFRGDEGLERLVATAALKFEQGHFLSSRKNCRTKRWVLSTRQGGGSGARRHES